MITRTLPVKPVPTQRIFGDCPESDLAMNGVSHACFAATWFARNAANQLRLLAPLSRAVFAPTAERDGTKRGLAGADRFAEFLLA
jgi:hypothetical protein